MKIAIISSPFFGVYPPRYGGAEVVVGNLARALVKRGHKVVLIAPDESQDFDGGFIYRTGAALHTVGVDWLKAEEQMWKKYDGVLDDFNIIHSHTWFGMEYRSKVRNPSILCTHTHHGHLNYKFWARSPPPFKLNFIGISKWMKHCYETGYDGQAPMKIPSEYCYNGVDMEAYPFQREKKGRLMFLGRIDPIKAPHVAIEVADKTETPLDIVGGTSFVANPQYVDGIREKCIQSKYASFVGEVNHRTKLKYLRSARALLIPSQFSEPFGLIAVESMACGTVPVALRDGALPEIIDHGRSGFICNTLEEMVKAVSEVDTIKPEDCRKRAETFSKEAMAERMEELYKRIVYENDEW